MARRHDLIGVTGLKGARVTAWHVRDDLSVRTYVEIAHTDAYRVDPAERLARRLDRWFLRVSVLAKRPRAVTCRRKE